MVATKDTAWLAGLIEGEGCISTSGVNSWRVQVKMTDEDVVRRCADVTGVGHVRGPYEPSANNAGVKPYWIWAVSRRPDVLAVVYMIFPLLGARRRARATECVRSILTTRQTHCRTGRHPKTTPGRCPGCRDESQAAHNTTDRRRTYMREYMRTRRAAH